MECGVWIAELLCSDCLQLYMGLDTKPQSRKLLGKEKGAFQDAGAFVELLRTRKRWTGSHFRVSYEQARKSGDKLEKFRNEIKLDHYRAPDSSRHHFSA